MEGMEDEDNESDEDDLTEEEKREADAMLKNLFSAMGVDQAASGGMPGMGMPGMGMPGMGMPGMSMPGS